MIQKKTAKGDIESRKGTFIAIGLVAVLTLVYAGFELFAVQDKGDVMSMPDEEVIAILDEDVIATDPTPPPPPPPVQQQQEVVLNIVQDNIAVTTDWDFNQDFDENFEVTEYVPIEIVQEQVDDTPPVHFAEEMPEFVGGMEAMYAFLNKNLEYPEIARNNNIQGISVIEFVVERDGSISNVRTIHSLYPECDKEAMRVIQMMPKWKPGKAMGKPVRVFFQIPVRFSLN